MSDGEVDIDGELPEGWRRVAVGEIAEARLGKMLDRTKHKTGASMPYLRNQNVRWFHVDCSDLLEMFFEPDEIERHGLRAGDILICEGGEPGRAAIWQGQLPGMMFQKAIHRVRPSAALAPEWLVYQLKLDADQGKLEDYFTGTTIKHFTGASLARYEIVLPPRPEQRRIVAKLESLQARSRRAREALASVPPLLEKLRQSILAAAFRGDLTADWRAQHPDVEPASELVKRVEATLDDVRSTGRAASVNTISGRAALSVGDPGLQVPNKWTRVLLTRVARLESGHTPSRNVPEYWGGSIPWLSIPDARDHHGRVIDGTRNGITRAGLDNSPTRLLPKGTVSLCRTAASIGYTTIFGREICTSQDFVNWICSPALLPEYLLFALLAEGSHLFRFAKGSTHGTIYFPEVKAFHIAMPPKEEQRAIVATIRAWLRRIEKIQRTSSSLSDAFGRVDSAILSKAFRGELVPQDPNDAITSLPGAPKTKSVLSSAQTRQAGKRASRTSK